ncbi:cytochrome P450 [Streptomyces sp. NPDC059837]|uniref:cytochrome P450 n=1 Tax=Streptomyces sp. NPDC059837 TaxID=3346968 RepID=UPI003651707F
MASGCEKFTDEITPGLLSVIQGICLAEEGKPGYGIVAAGTGARRAGRGFGGARWAFGRVSPCTFMRYAVDDVEIAGGTVPARGAVVAWIGSANRDGAQFPDPHQFDITRSGAQRQVAFQVRSALLSYFIAGMTHLPLVAQKRRTP